jgi:hypothetical protein
MPIHDWTQATDVFPHFHQVWSVAICSALNRGLLPSGYSALVDVHTSDGMVPDVLAVESSPRRPRSAKPTGGILLSDQPKTRHVIQANGGHPTRGKRIVIRHRLGELVSVIEIVSPGNKSSKNALKSFVTKSTDLLEYGVHLLVVDLFPPSKRDPQGIHKAIWDEIEEVEFSLPPDKPLTLVAYRAGSGSAGILTMAYVEPVGVGDVLPDMPAYIEHFGYVMVPLEATYAATFADCPPDMRFLVETGRVPGEDE